MCGIAGFVSNSITDFDIVLESMISKLNHRGPDSRGVWYDEEANIGLAHTRLSIIDLTDTGHQPMKSESERYIMVFNGEIYNHLAIRSELEKTQQLNWRGSSDTETLLKAIELWGLEKTVNHSVGMFAIALWDCKERELKLIRDRMGEKPLYYGYVAANFVFASELSAIKQMPGFNNAINRDAVALYMSYGSISEPYSIYQDINKLESGAILTFSTKNNSITVNKYWSIENSTINTFNPVYSGTHANAVNRLEELLIDAVKLQMISDVPIGAFLSGGVDSSTIVALMQSVSEKKIDTFSIGFEQKEYDEAGFASKVAKHLGTNHHETYVTDREALDIVPQLASIYSEPFSESSQIPTFLVSKIAKKNVTVSLSGDAGDELFGGYSRYKLSYNTWKNLTTIPKIAKNGIYELVNAFPYDFWYYLLLPFKGKRSSIGLQINFADKIFKGLPMLQMDNRKEFYHKGFMNHNLDLKNWLPNTKLPKNKFDTNELKIEDFYSEMMATDLMTYLPNNNLVKMDRAAMANSLETRVPFLDHRIVSFALSLPVDYKLHQGTDKWVLRQVLYKYVPRQLIERPKMGFAVPLNAWLRGPLKDWAESLISFEKLNEEGFFDAEFIRYKWDELQSGKRNWENLIWDVLMFQAWLENEKNK